MNLFILSLRKGVRWLFRGVIFAILCVLVLFFRFGFIYGITLLWASLGFLFSVGLNSDIEYRLISEGRFLNPNAAFQCARIFDTVAKVKEIQEAKNDPQYDENEPWKSWKYARGSGFIWEKLHNEPHLWYNNYKDSSPINRSYDWVEDRELVVDLSVCDICLSSRYPEVRGSEWEEPFFYTSPNIEIFDPSPQINTDTTIEQAHILAVRPVPLYRWFGRTYTIVMIDDATAKKYGMSSNVLFVAGASKARIYRAYDQVSETKFLWAWRFLGFFCQLFISLHFWGFVLVALWIWRRVVFCRRRRESTARLKRVGEVFQKFRKEHGRYPVSFEEAGLGDSPDRLDAVNKKSFILVERYDWGVRRKRALAEQTHEATSKRPRFEENKDRFLVMSARKYRFLAPLFGTVCALALLDDGSVRVLRNFLRVERMYDKLSYDRARVKKGRAKSLGERQ